MRHILDQGAASNASSLETQKKRPEASGGFNSRRLRIRDRSCDGG